MGVRASGLAIAPTTYRDRTDRRIEIAPTREDPKC